MGQAKRKRMSTAALAGLVEKEREASAARAEQERPQAARSGPQGWDTATPEQRLGYMRQVLQSLEADISTEVDRARSLGLPWVAIGRVFDITGEGARRRWG